MLKRSFLILGTALLLTACGSRSGPEKLPSPKAFRSDFKYKNLTEFQIDTFGWTTRREHYTPLNPQAHALFMQLEQRPYAPEYEPEFFYAWQERDSAFSDCVILYQDENGYCTLMKYCIFDQQGKAVDAFPLAARCGDAEWTFNSSSRAVNAHTFLTTSVETNMTGIDTTDQTELIEIDSVITEYTIGTKGNVSKRGVLKQHYQRKVCCYQEAD